MTDVAAFWKLDGLSDRELVDRLSRALGSGRRLTAELVAHLGEVEARRLHLQAACSSMFHYCVTRLRLSEDEACRRIEVARLARRFPEIFPLLASGAVSLSVLALLKHQLSADNATDLLASVCGQSLQHAREIIATRFPRPDVPASIRKLPPPRSRVLTRMVVATPLAAPAPMAATPLAVTASLAAPPLVLALTASHPPPDGAQHEPGVAHPDSRARLEPLSADRYRVQFTASRELKRKLELARDLMRHALPSGDLAAILERSLDLLLDDLMKRRFGKTARPRSAHGASPSRVRSATRRSVLERDGLQCSWVNEQGERCPATAWLEHDHRRPRAKGGNSEPLNIRIMCRAHNQWSAERDFGKAHIQRAIAQRKNAEPPNSSKV